MTHTLSKRIPVSTERWEELGRVKQAGQTYDELLADMMVVYNRELLREFAQSAKSGQGNWHNLEEI